MTKITGRQIPYGAAMSSLLNISMLTPLAHALLIAESNIFPKRTQTLKCTIYILTS